MSCNICAEHPSETNFHGTDFDKQFPKHICQKTFKHWIFKYWILQGNTDFDKQLPKHSLPKKNIQILDIVRKHRFFKQLPKHICQKNIQILDIVREHTCFDKQPLKHILPNTYKYWIGFDTNCKRFQ